MMKKFSAHWWVVIPSLIILLLLASVLTALLFFVGKSEEAQVATSPTAVSDQYEQNITALRTEIASSSEDIDTLIARAEDALLSFRVPQERLDTHLSAMVQLQALKRQKSDGDATMAKDRLLQILFSL